MAEKPFPFGAKSIEELEAREASKNPTPAPEPVVANEPVINEAGQKGEPTKVEPPKEETKTEPIKTTWLDEVNKAYKTDFKSPDDFKAVFEKSKKVDEYEPKVKGFEETEANYKKQLEQLQSSLKQLNNPLSYFSSPEAYVAEQLKKQYPDKNPKVLHDVVTSDVKVMDDLDVLIKDAFLNTPGLKGGDEGVRETILSEFGVDPTTPKDEWPISVQNRIMIKANQARKEWSELKSKVELPKVASPEEREAEAKRLQEEKRQKITPLKETFSKFDKFTTEIDGEIFDFNVTDEYKEVLPQMFDTYFVEAGLDVNEDNLKSMETLKRAMFLEQNFVPIYKKIVADAETKFKAKQDELLNNTNPTNTKTAAEGEENENQKFSKEYGLGKLFGKK